MIIPEGEKASTSYQNGSPTSPTGSTTGSQLVVPPRHPSHQYGRTSPIPPEYQAPDVPSTNVFYDFVVTPPSMVLVAPSGQGAYYITSNPNPFTPSSYITIIRKTDPAGEILADFEMSAVSSRAKSSVWIRGNEHPIPDIVSSNTRIRKNSWTWKPQDRERLIVLYWDESSGNNLTCFSSKDRISMNHMATFTPTPHARRQGRAIEYQRLEVTPKGHEVLDDIVTSLLIVERIRTNPAVLSFK